MKHAVLIFNYPLIMLTFILIKFAFLRYIVYV